MRNPTRSFQGADVDYTFYYIQSAKAWMTNPVFKKKLDRVIVSDTTFLLRKGLEVQYNVVYKSNENLTSQSQVVTI